MGASHSMEEYTDRPCLVTGLRRSELNALTASWAAIERDLRNHSIKLFVRFLRLYPNYRRYFRNLAVRGPPIATNVAVDARAQSHFRTIVTAIGSLVTTAATNPELLEPKYDFLAVVHRHLGIGLHNFFHLRDAFIEYLQSEFPSLMTPLCVGAWDALLTRAFMETCQRIDEFHRAEELHCPIPINSSQRVSEESECDATVSDISESSKSVSEHKREVLYWDHRESFWRTQRELWGETSTEDDDEDDQNDGIYESETYVKKPHWWQRWRCNKQSRK